MQIVEEYPFSGEMRQFKRRDLRKGQHLQDHNIEVYSL